MGVSGRVFSGAEEQLRQLIEEQIVQEQMTVRQQEAEARRKIDEAREARQAQAEASDTALRGRQMARVEAADAAEVTEADRVRRIGDQVSGLQDFPPDVQRSEARGLLGRIDPAAALKGMAAEPPPVPAPKGRYVNTPGPRGAVNRFVPEGEEADVYREPDTPKPTGPQGLNPVQGQTALKLQDDYARDSKPYMTMRDAFQRVASTEDSAAGDLSLIFAYMKILDPNSVVREAEFANAQNAAGIPDQVRNLYNRALNGERLNPTQRQQFRGQADKLFQNAEQNQKRVRQTYANRAKQWGIPAEMVLDEEETIQRPGAGGWTTLPNGVLVREKK